MKYQNLKFMMVYNTPPFAPTDVKSPYDIYCLTINDIIKYCFAWNEI